MDEISAEKDALAKHDLVLKGGMKGLDPLFGGNGASAAPSQAVYMPTNVRYCTAC